MQCGILNTIGEKYSKEARDILEKIGNVDCLDLSQEEVGEIIKDYEIAVVGLGLNFDKQVLARANRLKCIATITTGLDHIDLEYARENDIKVLSLKEERDFLNTITGTAELAFGLMIDLMRSISCSFDDVRKYNWDREKFRGHNLYGKQLGIIGLGRLGSMIARYGNSFGMVVKACDPYVADDVFTECRVGSIAFDELIKTSDIISIHVHLNEETRDMFDNSVFDAMKSGAYIVNTARGEIVNENDLLQALEVGDIGGYATDVLSGELQFSKGFSNHPLVEYAKKHDNCIIVPHIGGMTYESRVATDVFMAKKVVNWHKLHN